MVLSRSAGIVGGIAPACAPTLIPGKLFPSRCPFPANQLSLRGWYGTLTYLVRLCCVLATARLVPEIQTAPLLRTGAQMSHPGNVSLVEAFIGFPAIPVRGR
jgi:hypothetical protein